jgi:predicted RND superfamily exporter protein
VANTDKTSPQRNGPRGPFHGFSRFCLRHRVLVLVVVLIGTVYMGLAIGARLLPEPVTRLLHLPAQGIRIDASTRAFVLKNDPDRARYNKFLDRFGSDTMLAVGIEWTGSCFDEARLRRTLGITRRLEQHDDVASVLGLATVVYPTADGRLAELSDLLADDPVEPAALDRFAGQMTANRIVRENLIARDAGAERGPYTTSVLFVTFADGLDDEDLVTRGTINDIREIVRDGVGEGDTVRLVGNAVLREALARIIKSDLFIFLGVTQLLAAAAVYAIFRSLRTVVVIMVLVWVTLAWTFGIFVLAGYMINLVTAILVPVLITVCVTIAVHIFVYYNEEAGNAAGHDAVLNTAWRMGRPCFLTSLTTAIGLGSLAANRIGPIQAFGIFGAIGTMLSFLFAFALLPIALAAFGSPGRRRGTRRDRHPVLQLLGRCSTICVTHPWVTLVVAAGLAAAAILGITHLRVETRIVSYFKAREPIVKAYRSFDAKRLGITSLEVMVTSPEPDIRSPEIQRQVRQFADYMSRQTDHVASVLCLPYYDDERDRIRAELEAHGGLSPAEMLAALAKSREQTQRFVSPDRTSTRINIRLTDVTSRVLLESCRMIEQATGRFFDDSLDVHITGSTKLYANVVSTLVSGQIRSIALAFVAVTIVMAVVFRSIKIGLISMVPTMLPVLITLGMMGWVGIALNGATVMIASVAIGIVVDSAIHFLHRYRREHAAARDFGTAINRTLLTVGQPISYAVLILSCAFIVLALGNFNPTNYFGIMTAFTMLISLVITLLLLPVCLNLFHARVEKSQDKAEPRTDD